MAIDLISTGQMVSTTLFGFAIIAYVFFWDKYLKPIEMKRSEDGDESYILDLRTVLLLLSMSLFLLTLIIGFMTSFSIAYGLSVKFISGNVIVFYVFLAVSLGFTCFALYKFICPTVYDMANLHYEKENNPVAIRLYERVIKNKSPRLDLFFVFPRLKQIESHHNVGKLYLEKYPAKSISHLNTAMRYHSKIYHCCLPVHLGDAYLKLRQYNNALKSYRRAIKRCANSSAPWIGQGNVYKEMKQFDKAIECYKKSLKLNPDNDDAEKGLEECRKML